MTSYFDELGWGGTGPVTVRVFASAREGVPDGFRGLGQFCCETVRETIFIDVDGPDWRRITRLASHVKTPAHEYAHVWQYYVGCLESPIWLKEGMADFLAYRALYRGNVVTPSQVMSFITSAARSATQPNSLAARETYPVPAGESIDEIAQLAVELLVTTRGGVNSLRTFCRAVGARPRGWQDAFASAFGITPDAFYAAFEQYRKSLAKTTATGASVPRRTSSDSAASQT